MRNNMYFEDNLGSRTFVRLLFVITLTLIISLISTSLSHSSQMVSAPIDVMNVGSDQVMDAAGHPNKHMHSHNQSDNGCCLSVCHFFTLNDNTSDISQHRYYLTFYEQKSEPKLAFTKLEIRPPKVT